jgi:twitching motility protein PilJ
MALIEQQLEKEKHSSVEDLDSDLQNLSLNQASTEELANDLTLIDTLSVPQVEKNASYSEINAELNAELNALQDVVQHSVEEPSQIIQPEIEHSSDIANQHVGSVLEEQKNTLEAEPFTSVEETLHKVSQVETVTAHPIDLDVDSKRSVFETTIQNVTDQDDFNKRADQTMIGNVLERGGDIRLPLIGHLPLQKQIQILLTAMGASLLIGALFVYTNANQSKMVSTQVQIAGDILMNSQRIGKAAPNAIQGKPAAFTQLKESRKTINQDIDVLLMGGEYQGRNISKPSSDAEKNLQTVKKAWDTSNKAADTILKTQNELNGFRNDLEAMNVLTPDLVSLTDEISTQQVQSKASPNAIFASGQLIMLTQRLGRSASEYVTSDEINSEKAFLLGKDANTFNDIVEGFINGSEMHDLQSIKDPVVREKLVKLKKVFDDYRKHVDNITDPVNLKKFVDAKNAEQLIFNENEELKKQLGTLQNNYSAEQDKITISFWLLLVSAAFALLSAIGIALVLLQDSRNRTKESEQRRQEAEQRRQEADQQMIAAQKQEEQANAVNERNQTAILRLMNELQDVADGDLTVQATVSEDITGAIADSVNNTVEELRGLVGRVTNTAIQVTNASSQAQSISNDLLDASHIQAQEITEAGKAIASMANDITDVSRSANESAEVARQSVSAAEQGSRAVENTIKGMNEIREQIQETSKRIKRLGESSQEIGEITELISDITEQTNVLALNAAIQAASAGEAGRGFSVVAEEVQRLAERSAEATKQIGALVRTIQTDTHDAVAAMEKSTQEVVEGAKLSDAAGAALVNIRDVSNRLAELIQDISLATEQQATSANGVAQNIGHILSITEKTQNGTQQTSQSIKDLTKLAEELKNSVSRFRVVA